MITIEELKDNFTFCLFVGWILFSIAISFVGVYFSDNDSEWYRYRYLAWVLVTALGLIMFILQNIFIYLY